MKSKDIVIGTEYRCSYDAKGRDFFKGTALELINVERWDRINMKYNMVPGRVKVRKSNGDDIVVNLQRVFQTWEDFAAAFPEKVESYQKGIDEQNKGLKKDKTLNSYLPEEYRKLNWRLYITSYWGAAGDKTVNLRLTLDQYLAFVGKTNEEFEADSEAASLEDEQ